MIAILGGSKPTCEKTTVAILGAGTAGITAAQTLSNSSVHDFIIFEYNSDIGGRMRHTTFGQDANGDPITVELGANWVQGLGTDGGPQNPIWLLAQKYGVNNTYSDYSSILTYDETGYVNYSSLFDDFENAYSVTEELAGTILSENLQDRSTRAGFTRGEWQTKKDMKMQAIEWWEWDWEYAYEPEVSSLVYGIVNYNTTFYQWSDENNFVWDQRGFNTWLKGEARTFLTNNDKRLRLNTTITNVTYSDTGVTITDSEGSCYQAEYAICTFSLGVLQNEAVSFQPEFPEWKQDGIDNFDMGTYTKIFLQFPSDKVFWPKDTQYFLYADPIERGYYPVFQSLDTPGFLEGSGIIFVTVVHDQSYRVEAQTDDETKDQVMAVLRDMFGADNVPDPIAFMYPRWSLEPWAYGSYSNWPYGVTLEMHQNLRANVGRLYFAGEATSAEYFGFLQGAWYEGQSVAEQVVACLDGKCTQETHYAPLHGSTPWSRLVGGSRTAPKTPRTSSPVERLTAFKRSCNTLQQIWRSSNSPSNELAATSQARVCVDRLNHVLSEESRGPAPHPCLSYASTSQIFVTVTKLALTYRDEGLLRSSAVFFNTLIDAELDGIVDNRVFSRALIDLVRRNLVRTDDTESRLVELLFGVANNIRLRPQILTAWFIPKQAELPERELEEDEQFAGVTRRDDFPLFYLLVDYVHREGRAGDFARTGLLYLIETATRSRILEKWLIESDLATLMATGLGAVYSQLSRNVYPTFVEGNVPTIVALSDENDIQRNFDGTVRPDVESFISYLLFWQDTIEHCQSKEVNDTLLDHFEVLFLQQLLYPSLLESSDVKGGSTSTVLMYLCRLLESIDQPKLVHRTLRFLMAAPTDAEPSLDISQNLHKKHLSVSRRKSLDMLATLAEAEEQQPSPSLFNLADLILMSIKSQNKETVVATLRLLTVIVRRHHPFAGSLIKMKEPVSGPHRTVGALNEELCRYLSFATAIIDDPTLNDSFEHYSKDAAHVLESRLFIPSPRSSILDGPADQPLDLSLEDAIFTEILNLLDRFFSNSVTVNLGLTELITSLASSNLISLNGWLLVDPANYDYKSNLPPTGMKTSTVTEENMLIVDDEKPEIVDPLAAIRKSLAPVTWSNDHEALIAKSLRKLIEHLQDWRREIPDFDILVSARRDLLHSDDDDDISRNQRSINTSRQPSQPPTRSVEPPLSPRGRPISNSINQEGPLSSTPGSLPRSMIGSPLREPSIQSPVSSSPARHPVPFEDLRQRLASSYRVDKTTEQPTSASQENKPTNESQTDGPVDGSEQSNHEPPPAQNETVVTLGHILTNAVILYEFILELAAMVQVRGTLFEEAGYA
ncbi:hypothetical protein ZTR_00035 [Talaromyces verruculosus]|nr:hypothetical protein ZTR_00035 [Talaromyces verruculosus]